MLWIEDGKKRKKQRNVGSAVVEMTLLIPILLGIIYLYISLFLFLINVGHNMNMLAEALYSFKENSQESGNTNMNNAKLHKQGSSYQIVFSDTVEMFNMDLKICRYGDSAVKNIRRWQLAIDTVQKGKNE